MKIKFALIALLLVNLMNAQTQVGFTVPNQSFDFTKSSIEVKLDINKQQSKKSNSKVILEILSDTKDEEILFGITNLKGMDIVLDINDNDKTVKIPINKTAVGNKKHITLTIRKKDKNSNVIIVNNSHTVLLEKVEVPSAKIGFKESLEIVSIDSGKDKELTIPFKVNSQGYSPKEIDSVFFEVKIPEFDKIDVLKEYTKEFNLIGSETSYKIEIKSSEKTIDSFLVALDSIVNKDKLEIEITKIKHVSNSQIKISDQNKKLVIVTKSVDKEGYNYNEIKNRKYNFYIGTNFDLKDRFEANSFYSEIDVFLPNLIGKFGFRGGIYKNNSVSGELEEDRRDTELVQVVENSITNDSITIERKRVLRTPSVSYENLGLYFDVIFNLKKSENFEWYVSAHFEAIERREEFSSTDEDLFPLDRFTISIDSLSNNRPLQRLITQNRDRTRKYFSGYYGVGSPILYNNKYMQAFFYPTFGGGTPGFSISGSDTDWWFFGAFQFHLMEKKFGIKLSGDIRKYFGFGQNPIITINLSKSFNLTNIFENN